MTLEQHLKLVPRERCSCYVSISRAIPFRPGQIIRCTTCERLYRWRDELLRMVRVSNLLRID